MGYFSEAPFVYIVLVEVNLIGSTTELAHVILLEVHALLVDLLPVDAAEPGVLLDLLSTAHGSQPLKRVPVE